MSSLIEQSGLRRRSLAAGLCYLAVIAGGLFAAGAVRGSLIVSGDAAATAGQIAADETLWRWGIAVHLLYLIPAVAVNVLVADLIGSAAPTPARLALVFGVTAVGIEAVSLVGLYVPLVFAEDGGTLGSLAGGEREALVYLATRLFSVGFGFSLVLFAGFCLLVGAVIVRTRLMPRPIGWMMVVAGACYVVNTMAMVVAPEAWDAIFPVVLLPIVVAELSLAVWLVARGVRVSDVDRVAGRVPARA